MSCTYSDALPDFILRTRTTGVTRFACALRFWVLAPLPAVRKVATVPKPAGAAPGARAGGVSRYWRPSAPLKR